MNKAAILLMGLPGTGKGTQAFRITERFPNFTHFDTGGEIFRRINDPSFSQDPLVQQQKEIYLTGKLNDPEWVASLVMERIRFYAQKDRGVVFSGSPRTLYEAQTITPVLFESYGRGRVLIIIPEVSEETARQRSLNRLTCGNKTCRYPTTKGKAGQPCPHCGETLPQGKQEGESWKIDQLETRFSEYRRRTLPGIEYLFSLGLGTKVNGEKSQEEVFTQILRAMERLS
ncbi:MAG: adenylate kinase [Patescibacteria group bacterium]|nr:MAG: adenylate kinase [Patescibacteria group bacterium]